jgi:riboflavin synthase
MFTGLVETKGKLVRRTVQGKDARLTIAGDFALRPSAASTAADPARSLGGEPLQLGESIAVDGVCLTVDRIVVPGGPGPSTFEVDASAETLEKTTVGSLAIGAHVNLERAVPLGGRMGGHIVSGHVDGVGTVVRKDPLGAAVKILFAAPEPIARFVAPKGSICVSGVSLTVNGVEGSQFDVVLVPHTREKTSLDTLEPGAHVNLEVDVLARYVARLLESGRDAASSDASLMSALHRRGFV